MNQPHADQKLPTQPLSPAQIIAMVIYGIALWFVGATLTRTLGPGPLFYVLIVPGTIPVVALAPRMFKIAPQQVTSAIALITASAITFDSAAFALSPTLYAADQASAVIAASQIFWGGAVGLFMALLVEQRALR